MVVRVEAWLRFLVFHWTCVALCFTEGLPFVPKTVLSVRSRRQTSRRLALGLEERIRQEEETADRSVWNNRNTDPSML